MHAPAFSRVITPSFIPRASNVAMFWWCWQDLCRRLTSVRSKHAICVEELPSMPLPNATKSCGPIEVGLPARDWKRSRELQHRWSGKKYLLIPSRWSIMPRYDLQMPVPGSDDISVHMFENQISAGYHHMSRAIWLQRLFDSSNSNRLLPSNVDHDKRPGTFCPHSTLRIISRYHVHHRVELQSKATSLSNMSASVQNLEEAATIASEYISSQSLVIYESSWICTDCVSVILTLNFELNWLGSIKTLSSTSINTVSIR